MGGYRGKCNSENSQWGDVCVMPVIQMRQLIGSIVISDGRCGRIRKKNASVRLQGMAGFYCWMTNDLIHRQNDALTYAIGAQATYRGFTLNCDYTGIKGYRGDGDKPMIVRSKLNYEIKKEHYLFWL